MTVVGDRRDVTQVQQYFLFIYKDYFYLFYM
jgi:hypothetical protein